MGKPTPTEQPVPYRDEPDYAETASMSSAVLLDDVEYFPDEELPSYEDTPSLGSATAPPPSGYAYYA